MIAIINISPDAPAQGINKYRVQINEKVICEFEHHRMRDGLSMCLRAAADAVDTAEKERWIKAYSELTKE